MGPKNGVPGIKSMVSGSMQPKPCGLPGFRYWSGLGGLQQTRTLQRVYNLQWEFKMHRAKSGTPASHL